MTTADSPRTTMSTPRRPWTVFALGVLGIGSLAVVLGAVVLAALGRDSRQLELLGAAATVVAAGAATATGAFMMRAGAGVRPFVRTLAVALGLYCVGSSVFFVELLTGAELRPGLHDTLYLGAAALAMTAILRYPELGSRRQRLRILVDAAIFALSAVVVLWLLAGRVMWGLHDQPFATVAAVGAVACTFAATRAAVAVWLCKEERTRAEAAGVLQTIGFASLSASGVLHLWHHSHDLARWVAVSSEVLAVVGFSVIGVAGVMLMGAAPPFAPPHIREAMSSMQQMTPIVVSSCATLAVLVDAAVRGEFDATASGVLTVVICAVLLRQSLTLSDNRQLSASLRSTVDGLEHQATHDPLTGLPNRNGLPDRLAAASARAAAAGRTYAVFFVDVDHLKAINDSLGHGAGDLLIRTTADRLIARVGTRVTRFGGDEFVLVVDDLADAADAEAVGRRIVDDMARPVALEGHQVRSSASVGLAIGEPGATAEELLRRADVALYRAKALGRRCVAVYDPVTDAGKDDLMDLEPDLRRGVASGEFVLHYQPIVELGTGEMVSVESLLRWQHPERGLLGPVSFLDAAISSGVLGAIGEASLRTACTDFATLCVPDGAPPGQLRPPSVAVNLSSSELADRRVVERVAAALEDSALLPRRLTLEITEDVIVDEAVRATIDQLCELGVHLAIDDFGTGNSSLRQLGAYPADVLKIDKSFVDRLEHDVRARAITRSIVRLAANLGLTTLAEGVETEGQAELLARMGCDRAQGWLFAAAMPFDELVEWWRARAATGCRGYGDSRDNVASASSMIRSSS